MHDPLLQTLLLLARLGLGLLFVVVGMRRVLAPPALAEILAAERRPSPRPLLIVTSAFQVLTGACLVVGYQVTFAAIGLVVFALAASILALNADEAAEKTLFRDLWLSNLAILGGILVAAVQG
jgi:putative oxidoreductase